LTSVRDAGVIKFGRTCSNFRCRAYLRPNERH